MLACWACGARRRRTGVKRTTRLASGVPRPACLDAHREVPAHATRRASDVSGLGHAPRHPTASKGRSWSTGTSLPGLTPVVVQAGAFGHEHHGITAARCIEGERYLRVAALMRPLNRNDFRPALEKFAH